jgi:hypothetical protein
LLDPQQEGWGQALLDLPEGEGAPGFALNLVLISHFSLLIAIKAHGISHFCASALEAFT